MSAPCVADHDPLVVWSSDPFPLAERNKACDFLVSLKACHDALRASPDLQKPSTWRSTSKTARRGRRQVYPSSRSRPWIRPQSERFLVTRTPAWQERSRDAKSIFPTFNICLTAITAIATGRSGMRSRQAPPPPDEAPLLAPADHAPSSPGRRGHRCLRPRTAPRGSMGAPDSPREERKKSRARSGWFSGGSPLHGRDRCAATLGRRPSR